MTAARFFHDNYQDARTHFQARAEQAGAQQRAFPIDPKGPDGGLLAIDLAWIGAKDAENVLLITSGIHGVEGHSGSAIQLALLEELGSGQISLSPNTAVVMLHALNPYGFAHTRRFNPNNVDLNRNFLPTDQPYEGANAAYAQFNTLLNPESAPTGVDFFLLKAASLIVRYGMPAMKQAVAEGQYDYPKGLFFGGHEQQQESSLVLQCLQEHFSGVRRLLHIDCHTGLGKSGTYQLLIEEPDGSPSHNRSVAIFGDDIHPWKSDGSVAYQVRGGISPAVSRSLPNATVDSLTLEFGTYSELRVITALRAENRLHHWGDEAHPNSQRIKTNLREVFAPAKTAWRDRVVKSGLTVLHRAIAHLQDETPIPTS